MKLSTNDVRAILAILFTSAVIAGFFVGKTPPEVFFSFVGSAITYYFMSSPSTDDGSKTNAARHVKQLSAAVSGLIKPKIVEPNETTSS